MGVFRDAIQARENKPLTLALPAATIQDNLFQAPASGRDPAAGQLADTRATITFLKILLPGHEDSSTSLCLKSVIQHHFHSIGLLLRMPLRELFCYCGYRVTDVDIQNCKNRVRLWIHQRGPKACQMAYHAGQLFGQTRNSGSYSYYEGRAMMIACLAL